VPRAAGVASALGLVASDLVVERVLTRLVPMSSAVPADIAAVFAQLEARALAELSEGPGEVSVDRFVDMRFRGQAHELTVPAPSGPITPAALDTLVPEFSAHYQRTYGIELEADTEIVNFRVRVRRAVDKPAPVSVPLTGSREGIEPTHRRPLTFDGRSLQDCPIYQWEHLVPGNEVDGPAVIEGYGTSALVPPGFTAAIDQWSNVLLSRSAVTIVKNDDIELIMGSPKGHRPDVGAVGGP